MTGRNAIMFVQCLLSGFFFLILRHHNNGNFNARSCSLSFGVSVCSELNYFLIILFQLLMFILCYYSTKRLQRNKLSHCLLSFCCSLFYCSYYGTTTTGILMHTETLLWCLVSVCAPNYFMQLIFFICINKFFKFMKRFFCFID